MHLVAILLTLTASILAEAQSAFPRQTSASNITATATVTGTETTDNPVFGSVITSWQSAAPTMPPEISAWLSGAQLSSEYTYTFPGCPPSSTLLPKSLTSMYSGFQDNLTHWYSILAAGIGGIQTVDPQDVNSFYSLWMTSLCSSYTGMFSSVFQAAATPQTTTTVYVTPTGGAASGASSAWTASVIRVGLAGMLGVLALL
ncbi:hypothetical protein VM1G_09684 [Cytospora mali]|uniref:Uncharacterized protein n=1 Tax=Cytospora mali TaxID=578113 RepID=A0A194WD95_CYTMA|nr:hypothetical protein VM1G_09684 [Valsa mali]